MVHIGIWFMPIILIYWAKEHILYRKTQKLYKSLNGIGLVVNVERSNCMLMSCEQNVQQCDDINTGST